MKITTSRKPSAKARKLGKVLAGFLCVPYITRGKQGLDEEETWLVVVENHGNPTGLVKRSGDHAETLEFTISSEISSRRLKAMRPLVTGKEEDALEIASFFGLQLCLMPAFACDPIDGRSMKVASGQIDFVDEGETILRLKI